MLRQQDRFAIPDDALARGIENAEWPARLQKLGPGPLTRLLPKRSELWVDGGHNAGAARQVADHVRRGFEGDLPLVLLFASLSSKSPRSMLRPFRGLATQVHTLPIADHDHRSPKELTALADDMGFEASSNSSVDKALKRVKSPARVLVFGSVYLAGEVLKANGEIPD
jgi:dihydrofolate synthase / folylpolyglutamate synthase